MLGAGSLVGIYIGIFREQAILWIGLGGLFFAAAYSLPPFKLSYRGLGELVVGLTFGPLIVSGTFVVQTNFLSPEVFLASLPIGFLIANVLFINQYPDFEADSLGNKRNWVVRLGKTRGLQVYKALFACAFFSLIVLFIISSNPFWLLSFVTLPMVVRAVHIAALYSDDIPRFIRANANTVKTYQLTGLAMALAGLLTRYFAF